MNITVAALLQAARRSLAEAVRPELQSDHALSQLAAVQDVLGKLERMADWASVIATEEAAALASGLAAFETRAADAGLVCPFAAPGSVASLADLKARSRECADWLFTTVPPGALRDELDALLRAALREAVAAERRHVPRTDFSAMTGSKET